MGIDEAELNWFLENPCPPDVLGINHYLTSERFLDERTDHYPACSHGGNGVHNYADVEAVRVCAEGTAGPRALMKETWERYGLPLAVTEVHLGCTREEQLRWLKEVWDGAVSLRHEGVDVRAVTAWSLLGAYDWNSLVTRAEGYYEPGVFDLRGPRPRPTAIAWADWARLAASIAGVDASRVEARPTRELGLVAPRPTYSVLGSERGILLPSLDNAMSRYFDERQQF